MYDQSSSRINRMEKNWCLCSDHSREIFTKPLVLQTLKKRFLNYQIFNKILLALIYFYQVTLSYFFGGKCRFYPSCSHYALESYKQYNFIKASQLVLVRLSKCHPFSKMSGYDPIPFIDESNKI